MNIFKLVMSIYGLLFAIAAVLIIFLIIRRRRVRRTEDFEKRDN